MEGEIRQFSSEFAMITAQNATIAGGADFYRILIAESS